MSSHSCYCFRGALSRMQIQCCNEPVNCSKYVLIGKLRFRNRQVIDTHNTTETRLLFHRKTISWCISAPKLSVSTGIIEPIGISPILSNMKTQGPLTPNGFLSQPLLMVPVIILLISESPLPNKPTLKRVSGPTRPPHLEAPAIPREPDPDTVTAGVRHQHRRGPCGGGTSRAVWSACPSSDLSRGTMKSEHS